MNDGPQRNRVLRALELIVPDHLTKGHGKPLLVEPDHARRAAESEWSVRPLKTEITDHATVKRRQREPRPDQLPAASRLGDPLAHATGYDIHAVDTTTATS